MVAYASCDGEGIATGWLQVDWEGGVEREQVFRVGQEELWNAVTEASVVSAWFGAVPDRNLVAGSRVRFTWPDGSTRTAVVEIADAPKLIALRWLPFGTDPTGRTEHLPGTLTRLVLKDDLLGTRLVVTETDGLHSDFQALRTRVDGGASWALAGR